MSWQHCQALADATAAYAEEIPAEGGNGLTGTKPQDSYTGLNRSPRASESCHHTLTLSSASGTSRTKQLYKEEKAALQTPSAQSC